LITKNDRDDCLMWDCWASMTFMPALTAADELGLFSALDGPPLATAELAAALSLPAILSVSLGRLTAIARSAPIPDGFDPYERYIYKTKLVQQIQGYEDQSLTHFLKSNVVVMVTTGEIGREARRYANKIMADSNLCVVMIDGNDLAMIEARPAAIVDVLNREALHAMDMKKLEL